MNYQKLLHQMYVLDTEENEAVRIIENPYDIESCKKKTSDSSYDLSVLNTSIPAQEIVEMVQNSIGNDRKSQGKEKGIRILFYGLSGAGKTNLAHYIAESLGKGIITKNASDILGMYVGESEKNIAKAFEEASQAGRIVFLVEQYFNAGV